MLVANDAVSSDANAVPDAQPARRLLLEHRFAPVAETHRNAHAILFGATLLHLVADHRAADRAGDRGRVVAAPAADLVAEDAADHASEHRAGAARAAALAHDVDGHHAAVLIGGGSHVLVVRSRGVAIAVMRPVGRARAERERDRCCQAKGLVHAISFHMLQTRRNTPISSDTMKAMRKMEKRIFAIPAAPAAMPPKPRTAATSAMMKNTAAQ